MTPRRALALAAVAAAGIAAAAWWWGQRAGPAAGSEIVLQGNVDIRQVELAFNASGRIARVMVREGERVEPGQPVAELDTEAQSHAVAEARARVAAQREAVAALEAGSRPEEVARARAEHAAREAEVAEARRILARTEALVAQGFVSRQQADTARYNLEAARARERAAREALALVNAGPRAEDKAAARATLEALRAAAALAERRMAEGVLAAPAAGVVENRILEPGDMASPQRPVITLALTEPLWVRAYLDEPDLGRVPTGALAWVATDSHPGKRYAAWVGFVSPTAEFTPKSVETRELRTALVYQVRVFVCRPAGELRLGMPATVHIPVEQPVPLPQDPCEGRS